MCTTSQRAQVNVEYGDMWRASLGGGMSQSVRYIGSIGEGDGKHFGIAGVHNGKQGVGITKNGGITFKSYPIPELTTDARYAVYPNEKVCTDITHDSPMTHP